MKKLGVLIIAVALSLTAGARSSEAASILFYVDFSVSTDRMAPALAGHTVTTATSPTDFATTLGGGGFDLAIFLQQTSAGADYDSAFAAIAVFLASGGAAIANDWTRTAAHALPFETSFTDNNNNPTITVTAAGLLSGITNPVDLTNPGWGIFSTGLAAIGGGICGATFANGDCAIVIGLGGRAIFNGMLADTFVDGAEGTQLFINEINMALNGVTAVPEPATLGLLGLGLAAAVAARRRQTRARS